MHQYYLLALLPTALGCLNANSNACASYIKSNAAASTFCATFTRSTVTATTALPAWATNCSNKPSLLSAECTCHYSGAAGGGSSPSTTLKTTTTSKPTSTQGGGAVVTPPTGVTTTLPKSSGATYTSKPITVSAGQSYDGGLKKFDRSPRVCAEQDETGEADAMFVLEDGATLSNVIIGPDQAEGVHCKGQCNNVWWEDVCEDALTLKQPSGNSYVNGGGAFKASDKIIQFNGFGTVNINNFYANDYGKVVRSCGNCSGNGKARNVIINNMVATDGGVLCGINTNYGDTCWVTNSCQDSNKICDRYTGNNNGAEPPKIGSGPDGTYCKATGFTTAC
ncbi:pectate lyase [Colletotrichum higginsianum]|uniref:Pectate lyase n=1 Tax=Colletotrichum higginsianum (strain IMI 349063) TaxID=759273 RepID=H1W3X3_COLHI|nr:Pectate lyase [Colletotrichum higginsianum IMI 349063]OBR04754.1 Pectate lyase [Colletotrichum higginsianum IMI 349063]CCF47186.1 pectate lyase [Colletotrichum higginsianum]